MTIEIGGLSQKKREQSFMVDILSDCEIKIVDTGQVVGRTFKSSLIEAA